MKKVILISIDGMRPDGLLACGNPFVEEMKKRGSYTLTGSSMNPSVTLPCHMSIFHSVPPTRHGITTNQYIPPVRPIRGLFEVIKAAGGKSGMFFGWGPMREVARAESIERAEYVNAYSAEHTDGILTDRALSYIAERDPDFVYLYMVETDEKGGHDNGWMSPVYLDYIARAIDNVKRVIEAVGDRYTVIVTADHGGHDRMHGTELPEDMTVPMFFIGEDFEPGRALTGLSLIDLAPTVVDVMGLASEREWEGKSVK